MIYEFYLGFSYWFIKLSAPLIQSSINVNPDKPKTVKQLANFKIIQSIDSFSVLINSSERETVFIEPNHDQSHTILR